MAARSATPQPLWALVPTAGRARYLRRTATAILDELEDLAGALADTVGQPRTEAVLAELLPSVGGLHDLADHGPRALRDRRLGRIPALRAGRRSLLVSGAARDGRRPRRPLLAVGRARARDRPPRCWRATPSCSRRRWASACARPSSAAGCRSS